MARCKIKLIKGASYSGFGIKATKRDPIIEVDDAIAKKAVASGFFAYLRYEAPFVPGLITGNEVNPEDESDGTLTTAQEVGIAEMSFEQLKATATQMGINIRGLRSKASLIRAIESEAELSAADYGV